MNEFIPFLFTFFPDLGNMSTRGVEVMLRALESYWEIGAEDPYFCFGQKRNPIMVKKEITFMPVREYP